jgi:Outer membrane protein beta-barrel domain
MKDSRMHSVRGALRGGAAGLCLLAAAAVPAAGQGFTVNGQAGYFGMKASDSAKAVFGTSGGFTAGGGMSYGFGKHFYIEGGVRSFSKTGEKVFVATAGDPVFKLGFPLKARLRPIYGTIGYRFVGKSALVPYVGIGAGSTSYREESTVAGITTTETQSKSSFHGLIGVEYGRGHLRLAAEAIYTSVPNAIGVGGVSKVYGEDDLGGFVVLGKLIYSFGTR